MPMCEKNGPDSPSGLARTARSARLRFCLLGGLFLYKAYACLGEAKPRRLVQDKHTPKCHFVAFIKNIETPIILSAKAKRV